MDDPIQSTQEKVLKPNTKLKFFIQDYWDIFLGVFSIIFSFYLHKIGQGGMATLFAAIGIGALSITVSILITVPVLMGLAYLSGIRFTLDFNPLEIGALILTIILAWKTTDEGQTNYFEGISHLMFFVAFAIIAAYY